MDTLDNAPSTVADPVEPVLAAAGVVSRTFLKAGALAPLFSLKDSRGVRHALLDWLTQGPVVLSFHRGTWCDFCVSAMGALASVEEQIAALGATLIVIAPTAPHGPDTDRPLSVVDIGLSVAGAYGLVFELPVEQRALYLDNGYTPPPASAQGEWLAPAPATYVIGQDGRIVLAFLDVDYRQAMDPGLLVSVLTGLRRRQQS